jgi:hypothetical protein
VKQTELRRTNGKEAAGREIEISFHDKETEIHMPLPNMPSSGETVLNSMTEGEMGSSSEG